MTLSTAVHYETTVGKLYFAGVRLVHWGLTPWVLSRWAVGRQGGLAVWRSGGLAVENSALLIDCPNSSTDRPSS